MNLKSTGLLFVLSGISLASAQDAGPMKITGSLFNSQAGRGVILSRTATLKGDLLTIVVSEQATGSTTASTTSSKKDSTTVNASVLPIINTLTSQFLTGIAKNAVNSALGGGSTGASSSTAGAGSSSTSTSFTTNVTVIVKEVLPNGYLLVEGKRTIKMNKQTQDLLLEGTVRPDDIRNDNTVLSSNVAELRLIADGKGLIADRQREGLLTKILSWIF